MFTIKNSIIFKIIFKKERKKFSKMTPIFSNFCIVMIILSSCKGLCATFVFLVRSRIYLSCKTALHILIPLMILIKCLLIADVIVLIPSSLLMSYSCCLVFLPLSPSLNSGSPCDLPPGFIVQFRIILRFKLPSHEVNSIQLLNQL
ncbi:hypothetical protein BpHYR1_044188 [Brachionus plicatilis]|uniref:Uncharacterized protein n=1 Tax=Brachionus plicatilis TaxID=10195 RepID=A0A3M7PAK7_BRAPC|nr:hypothetical protein BpHYR1_044188 [Brachionus plicatilis]